MLGSLVGVVVGAVLAMASGIATELWKQRRARQAIARLLWFDVLRNWAQLFDVMVNEQWPTDARFFVDGWKALGEKLAVGTDPDHLLELAAIFAAVAERLWQRILVSTAGAAQPPLGAIFRQPREIMWRQTN